MTLTNPVLVAQEREKGSSGSDQPVAASSKVSPADPPYLNLTYANSTHITVHHH